MVRSGWSFSLRGFMIACTILGAIFAYYGRRYYVQQRKNAIQTRIAEQDKAIVGYLDRTIGEPAWWKKQLSLPSAMINGGFGGGSGRTSFNRKYEYVRVDYIREPTNSNGGSRLVDIKAIPLCCITIQVESDNALQFPPIQISATDGPSHNDQVVKMVTDLCDEKGWEWTFKQAED